jgi:hypothetical protein
VTASEQGALVLEQLRHVTIDGFDAVAALSVALGRLIAEQSYPDEPQLTIICCGAIIGAASRHRRDEMLATGGAVLGNA